jgi:tRNA uridine 5-carbamoylmethylation protein Kti12
MKVLILKGLPGSGKTTWAKEFCEKNKDWVRVNRDDLRRMRVPYWVTKQENMITEWERACILSALANNLNVIVDATNFNEINLDNLKRVIRLGRTDEVAFETKFFDVSLEDCIKNDLKRENSVGEKVIRNMYNKYLRPKIEQVVYDSRLSDCILSDLDGTLAILGNRNPYDRDFENDKVNEVVRHIFVNYFDDAYIDYKQIIFSGRSDKFKTVTEKWLTDNNIYYNILVMRKEGDVRKDVIVKKEMYEEYIKGKYNCQLILDDRNSCVELWRSLGLTCFQVADGNF